MGKGTSDAALLHLLELARGPLRNRTRSHAYFARGDSFAELFLGRPLSTPTEYNQAVGTDLPTALDTIYEDLVQQARPQPSLLQETTRHLQERVDITTGAATVRQFQLQMGSISCPLLDVASALLTAITALGHETLVRRTTAAVADAWLQLWRESVAAHNDQQQLHSGLCMLRAAPPEHRRELLSVLRIPDEYLRPAGGTFLEGATRYLDVFSESGAAAMALVGALPFARNPGPNHLMTMITFLRTKPDFLRALARVLRFAQDVRFNPLEPLSTGVFALATERNVSVMDVDASRISSVDIETKLRTSWDHYRETSLQQMDAMVSALSKEGVLGTTMSEIVEVTRMIVQRLARVDLEMSKGPTP